MALLVVLCCGPAQAEIYKWTDATGATHFSDQPPADAAATQVRIPATQGWAAPASEPGVAAAAAGRSAPKRVVMYGAQWCGYCRKARRYFDAHGIAYREYDIEKDAAAGREFKRLGGSGVPLILVGEARLQGFSQGAFERLYGQ